jgi:hypothetical protein
MEHLPTVEVTGPHQTRPESWPAALTEFADALEAVLAQGDHSLSAVVEGLNRRGAAAPGGGPWTEASLRARLAELGA